MLLLSGFIFQSALKDGYQIERAIPNSYEGNEKKVAYKVLGIEAVEKLF